jgi:hypothetical protein
MTSTAVTATKKPRIRKTKAQLVHENLCLQGDNDFLRMIVSDLSKENADATLHQTLGHLLDDLEMYLRWRQQGGWEQNPGILYGLSVALQNHCRLARLIVGPNPGAARMVAVGDTIAFHNYGESARVQ